MCPYGYWQPNNGETSCLSARRGFYTDSICTIAKCPIGRYGPVQGQGSEDDCDKCPPGRVCGEEGIANVAATGKCWGGRFGDEGQTSPICTGDCFAGFYCPNGTARDDMKDCGGIEFYCPEGVASPIPADDGLYTTPLSSDPRRRINQTICEPGHYCVDGLKEKCSEGFFGGNESLSSPECDGRCEAGYWCLPGSKSPMSRPCSHSDPSKYCPQGIQKECNGNRFTVPEDGERSHRVGCVECPMEYSCFLGLRTEKMVWKDRHCGREGQPVFAPQVRQPQNSNVPFGSLLHNEIRSPYDVLQYDIVSVIQAGRRSDGTLCQEDITGDGQFKIQSVKRDDVFYFRNGDLPNPVKNYSDGPAINQTLGQFVVPVGEALTFESCDEYKVEVIADLKEDSTVRLEQRCNITIKVEFINFPPVKVEEYGPLNKTLEFFSRRGQTLGESVGEPLSGIFRDPDNDTLTFSLISDEMTIPFRVDACSGNIVIRDSFQLQWTNSTEFFFFVLVSDNHPNNPGEVYQEMTVKVLDRNRAPRLTDPLPSLAIVQGTEKGDQVLVLRDGHPTDQVEYITDPQFVIDPDGGNITAQIRGCSERHEEACLAFEVFSSGAVIVRNDSFFKPVIKENAPSVLPVVYTDGTESVDADIPIRLQPLRTRPLITSTEIVVNDFASGFLANLSTKGEQGDTFVYELLEIRNNRKANETRLKLSDHGEFELRDEEHFVATECTDHCKTCETFDGWILLNVRVNASNEAWTPGPSSSGITPVNVTIKRVYNPPQFTSPVRNLTMEELDPRASVDISEFFCEVDGRTIFYEIDKINPMSGVDEFKIRPTTGKLEVVSSTGLNYEDQQDYTFEFRVSHSAMPKRHTLRTLKIYVVDVPEAPIVHTSVMDVPELTGYEDGPFGVINISDPDILAGTGKPFSSEPSVFAFFQDNHVDKFFVNETNGLVFVAPGYGPNFEELFPEPFFQLQVRVVDIRHGLETEQEIRINILDVDEPPTFDEPGIIFYIDIISQRKEFGRVQASDPDINDTLTFQVLEGPDFVRIEETTGLLFNRMDGDRIDHELQVGDRFTVTLEVKDSTNLTDRANYTIAVIEEQTNPIWQGRFGEYFKNSSIVNLKIEEHHRGTLGDFELDCEDPNGGPVTFSLRRTNPSFFFDILRVTSRSGRLEVKNSEKLDFETLAQTHGILEVACTDKVGRHVKGEVNLTVLDIDEPPEFTKFPSSPLSIREDEPIGIQVASVLAFDQDESSRNQLSMFVTIWEEPGEDSPVERTDIRFFNGGHFLEANLTLSDELDFNERNLYAINVTVVDEVMLSISEYFILEVTFVNSPPSFLKDTFTVLVPENIETEDTIFRNFSFTARTPVGSTIEHEFAVISSYPVSDGFQFKGCRLLLANNHTLDYETQPVYHLVISVTDHEGLSDRANVTLHVENVNDIFVSSIVGHRNLSTAGGETICMTGFNFGPKWRALSIMLSFASPDGRFYNQTQCVRNFLSQTNEWDNTLVYCDSPPGIGSTVELALHAGSDSFSSAELVANYLAPTVVEVKVWPVDARTSGGDDFKLDGWNFGPSTIKDMNGTEYPTPVSVNYENSWNETYEAGSCRVDNHAEISCEVAEGRGEKLRFRATIGFDDSTWKQNSNYHVPTTNIHYAPPVIASVAVLSSSVPTSGVQDGMRIQGSNFGLTGQGVTGTFSNAKFTLSTSCVSSVHNHTDAVCDIPEGVGTEYRLAIHVAGLSSNFSEDEESFSYDAPMLFDVVDAINRPPADLDTKGDDTIFLNGENFGPTPWPFTLPVEVYYGYALEYRARNCTLEKSHVRLTCTTIPGIGKNHEWQVFLATQSSNVLSNVSNYHPPVVETFYRNTTHRKQVEEYIRDFETSGGEAVFIRGRYFGPPATVPSRVYYGIGDDTFSAHECAAQNDETLVCLTGDGAGKGHIWTLVIGNQTSEMATIGYARPYITDFEGVNGSSVFGLSTTGGDQIDILGENFGPSGNNNQLLGKVTFGPTGIEQTARSCVVLEQSRIRCTVGPGIGFQLAWRVTIAGQTSMPSKNTTWYTAPSIVSLAPDHGPTGFSILGGEMPIITAKGFDFGFNFVDDVTVSVLMDPRGLIWRLAEELDLDNVTETLNRFLHLRQTSLDYLNEAKNDDIPAEELEDWLNQITNISIGRYDISWDDDEAGKQLIRFRLPEGHGTARPLMVQRNERISVPAWFDYDPPSISNIAPRVVTNRSFEVVIDGENFCDCTSCCGGTCCASVLVNGEEIHVPSANILHDRIVFDVDRSNTSLFDLEIIVQDQAFSAGPVQFSKVAPRLSNQDRFSEFPLFGTSGGELLALNAVDGIDDEVPVEDIRITIGNRECAVLTAKSWQGDDGQWRGNVSCLTPANVGKKLDVRIGIHDTLSPAGDLQVDYASPTICRVQGLPEDSGMVLYSNPASECTDRGFVHVGPQSLPTVGSRVSIKGLNLGSESLNETSELVAPDGFRGDFIITNHYHTHIDGIIPEGTGTGRTIIFFTWSRQLNSAEFELNFAPPLIEGVLPQSVPTLPGEDFVLRIRGQNFGPPTGSLSGSGNEVFTPDIQVSFGGDTCALIGSNHTLIECLPPEGQGDNKDVGVSIDSQNDRVRGLYYRKAKIDSITTTTGELPTSGEVDVTVTGENFGTSGEVRVADQVIENVSFWHSNVVFPLPAGHGENLALEVFVHGWKSLSESLTEPFFFSYDPPEISGIYRLHDVVNETKDECVPDRVCQEDAATTKCRDRDLDCFPTTGEAPLLLEGNNFGNDSELIRINIGNKDCGINAGINHLVTHNRVICILPRGAGTNLEVSLTVGTVASIKNVKLTYDAPKVFVISPDSPDAEGETLQISGRNFGPRSRDVVVLIDDQFCSDALVVNDGRITCQMQRTFVSAKKVNITVIDRELIIPQSDEMIVTECKRGWHGLEGEYCTECPTGAVCPGGERFFDKMHAADGWWRINISSPASECPENTQNRTECPVFHPCKQKSACLGANQCMEGYTSAGCEKCEDSSYFRLQGRCEACPHAPTLLTVIFVLSILVVAIGGYIVNSKELHLVTFTIGLDYVQLVAVFVNTSVDWTSTVNGALQAFSIVNFNSDLAAMDCYTEAAPSFPSRWLAIIGTPVAFACILFIVGTIQCCCKCCVSRRPMHEWCSHADPLISTIFLIVYVMYQALSIMTFQVFDCESTDGTEYLSADTDVKCYESGGVHQEVLVPVALTSGSLYVVLFPLVSFFVLLKNRRRIFEDQLLRVLNVDESLADEEVSIVRNKYQRMYGLFRPSQWYWTPVILIRKALVALVLIALGATSLYKMAISLLVIFSALVLQLLKWPYLSKLDYSDIKRFHLNCVAGGRRDHMRVQSYMQRSVSSKADRKKAEKTMRKQKAAVDESRCVYSVNPRLIRVIASYNIVESITLSSALAVNLLGIILESELFEDGGKSNLRDAVGAITFVILITTVIYIVVAVAFETLAVYYPETALRIAAKCSFGDTISVRDLEEVGGPVPSLDESKTWKQYKRENSCDTQVNPLLQPKNSNNSEQ